MQHENCAFWAKTVIIDSWELSHSRKLHHKKHDNLFWIWSDCSRKTAAREKIVDVSQESVRFHSIYKHRKRVVWCRQPKAHNISSVSQKKATQQVGWKRAWAAWGLGVSKSGSCMYRMRTRPRRELNLPPTNQIRVSKRRAPFFPWCMCDALLAMRDPLFRWVACQKSRTLSLCHCRALIIIIKARGTHRAPYSGWLFCVSTAVPALMSLNFPSMASNWYQQAAAGDI